MSTTKIILLLIAAGFPLGLIIIKFLNGLFANHDLTLGKVSSICTNIIGSLTKHNLAVKNIYYDNKLLSVSEKNEIEVEDLENKSKSTIEQKELQKELSLKLAAITSSLCHYQKMAKIEKQTNEFLWQSGFSKNEIISKHQIITTLETDNRKRISTVVVKDLEDENIFSFSKGNPYAIIKRCQRMQVGDQKVDITPTIRRKLKRRIDKLNKRGQKVIAFAYKGLPKKQYQVYSEEFAENDLILTAIFAFINPINNKVLSSIQRAKDNNIKIYIVTGSQEKKAIGLGIKLGLINPNYFESITGSQLQDLNEKKLAKMLSNKEKDYVFSEMKNSEKERIFMALHEGGETIALTDKNDEESLNKLMDKVIEGKSFYEAYLKCVYHNWTLKVAELFLLITALFTQHSITITLTAILIMEIAVNTILGLSLKAEKTSHIIKNSPQAIISEGVFMGIPLVIIYIFISLKYGWSPEQTLADASPISMKSSTMFIVTLTIFQIINAYRIRNLQQSFFGNVHLLLSTIILILLIYIFTSIEIAQGWLGFTKLSTDEWQVITFAIVIFLSLHYLRKIIQHDANTETRLPENQSHS